MITVSELSVEQLRDIVRRVLDLRTRINNGWVLKDENDIDKLVGLLDAATTPPSLLPSDPYTTAARLCDDSGMVSHEPVTDRRIGELPGITYLGRFNLMRVVIQREKPIAEPFACTGSWHIAGDHILCVSAAHRNTVPMLDWETSL